MPVSDKHQEEHTKAYTTQIDKIKDRKNIKTNKEKQQLTYKGFPIRLSAMSVSKKEWQDIYKVIKGKSL